MKTAISLRMLANAIIAFIAFFLCLATMWQFVWYLSSHDHVHFRPGIIRKSENIAWPLCVDVALMLIFVIQHSCMARKKFKQILSLLDGELEILERTVYIVLSCISLQLVMTFWKPIHGITLWEVDTASNPIWWWIFTFVHWFFWFTIYGGVLLMDGGELLGIKQVYYSFLQLAPPLHYKSRDLQRLYRHMRHSNLTGMAAILYVHPVMRIDRLLLAAVVVVYVFLASNVDERDHVYLRQQLRRKDIELHRF